MNQYTHLSRDERVVIQTLLQENKTQTYIAQRLKRSRSTISREIRKRTNRQWIYCADNADHHAYTKRLSKRKQMKKIRAHDFAEAMICDMLRKWRSAEKISLRLARDLRLRIAGITIRRYLTSRFWSSLYEELIQKNYLKRYKARNTTPSTKGKIKHRVSIDLRPMFVSTPITTGHYECDFIVSPHGDSTVILTLVDKYSRFKIARLLPDKKAWRVRDALASLIDQYGIKTITFDNDLSFAYHYQLWVKTYFCDPYSSWQKGQIERANRDRRRYFEKQMKLKNISQAMLDVVTMNLNHQPMKCFAWRTPREVHFNTSINYLYHPLYSVALNLQI